MCSSMPLIKELLVCAAVLTSVEIWAAGRVLGFVRRLEPEQQLIAWVEARGGQASGG